MEPFDQYFASRGLRSYAPLLEAGATTASVKAVFGYIEGGIPAGDFVTAVLCDSLARACQHADVNNKHAIWAWASFLFNECPAFPRRAWGSVEDVEQWRAFVAENYPERTPRAEYWKHRLVELLQGEGLMR